MAWINIDIAWLYGFYRIWRRGESSGKRKGKASMRHIGDYNARPKTRSTSESFEFVARAMFAGNRQQSQHKLSIVVVVAGCWLLLLLVVVVAGCCCCLLLLLLTVVVASC